MGNSTQDIRHLYRTNASDEQVIAAINAGRQAGGLQADESLMVRSYAFPSKTLDNASDEQLTRVRFGTRY